MRAIPVPLPSALDVRLFTLLMQLPKNAISLLSPLAPLIFVMYAPQLLEVLNASNASNLMFYLPIENSVKQLSAKIDNTTIALLSFVRIALTIVLHVKKPLQTSKLVRNKLLVPYANPIDLTILHYVPVQSFRQ